MGALSPWVGRTSLCPACPVWEGQGPWPVSLTHLPVVGASTPTTSFLQWEENPALLPLWCIAAALPSPGPPAPTMPLGSLSASAPVLLVKPHSPG